MQQVREIALRNGESNKLEARSERRLSDGESQELTVLLDQIAAHYPHQTFGEETGGDLARGVRDAGCEVRHTAAARSSDSLPHQAGPEILSSSRGGGRGLGGNDVA